MAMVEGKLADSDTINTPEDLERALRQIEEERAKTTIKPAKKKAERDSKAAGLDAPVKTPELRRQLSLLANLVSRLVRSEARFVEEDFDNLATSLVDLFARIPPARVILRLLGPLAAVGEIVDKARAIMDGRKTRQQEQSGNGR